MTPRSGDPTVRDIGVPWLSTPSPGLAARIEHDRWPDQAQLLPPVAFVQRVDAAARRDFDNGYADRREGVFDLVHADGRPILRHWATIDAKLHLRTSTFDVEDAGFPLPEAVMPCLARHLAWRS